ncbi:MAG: TauD/TfdA family dioxygenase, partial [Pseudomonadota bacterium]
MAKTLELGAEMMTLRWDDGSASQYPYIWLRDNCPSGFHPKTQERTADLLALPTDPRPKRAQIEGGDAVVDWEGEAHVSRFGLEWLRGHAPGQGAPDAAGIAPVLWRGSPEGGIARHGADAILTNDAALRAWLEDLAAHGIAIVDGVGAAPEASVALAERIGFLRKTNFGTTFEVINRPDPNNLAYTAERLPLHTDLPNQEVPPGFQFLHCIANEAEGGGSLFADGFAMAEDLRTEAPN